MKVLPGLTDRRLRDGRATGEVLYIHGGKCERLARVYGRCLKEMRCNKDAVARMLDAEYVPLWCEMGGIMTPTMRVALRVLRVFGKEDFAILTPKPVVRAMYKRGIIDEALDIQARPPARRHAK